MRVSAETDGGSAGAVFAVANYRARNSTVVERDRGSQLRLVAMVARLREWDLQLQTIGRIIQPRLNATAGLT